MDSNVVPLWAFLLTAFAAVVGPIFSSWRSSRNAVTLLREQHALEQQVATRTLKSQTYVEALSLYGRIRNLGSRHYAVHADSEWRKEFADLIPVLHEVNAKVAIIAPANVTALSEVAYLSAYCVIMNQLLLGDPDQDHITAETMQADLDAYIKEFDAFSNAALLDVKGHGGLAILPPPNQAGPSK